MTTDPDSPFLGFAEPHDHWTKLPHALIDQFAAIATVAELKVILYVLRHTWGFQNYDAGRRITLDEFCYGRKRSDGTRIDGGTHMSVHGVKAGVRAAIEHGFLTRESDGRDPARSSYVYRLKRCVDEASSVDGEEGYPAGPLSGHDGCPAGLPLEDDGCPAGLPSDGGGCPAVPLRVSRSATRSGKESDAETDADAERNKLLAASAPQTGLLLRDAGLVGRDPDADPRIPPRPARAAPLPSGADGECAPGVGRTVLFAHDKARYDKADATRRQAPSAEEPGAGGSPAPCGGPPPQPSPPRTEGREPAEAFADAFPARANKVDMPPPFVVPEGMTPAEYVMQRAMEAHMEAVARGAERDDWALNRFAQVWEARHGTAPFEAIVTLGQMLETRLGMRPDWTAKAEVSSWLSGLEKALRAAEGDPDLVVETALDMRDAGLAIPSPFSLVNLVRDAAARKRVPTPRGPAIHWLN